MTKKLVYQVTCSLCTNPAPTYADLDGEAPDGGLRVGVEMSLGSQTVELDLCAAHYGKLESVLAPYFAVGTVEQPLPRQTVRRAPRARAMGGLPFRDPELDSRTCRICDRVVPSRAGLGEHGKRVHGKSRVRDVEVGPASKQPRVPQSERKRGRSSVDTECRTCGFVAASRDSLGKHLRRHGKRIRDNV